MAFKKFGQDDREANSEKIASLFRECSGIGGEVQVIEAAPHGYGAADLEANEEKVARFQVEMHVATQPHPAIADASTAADYVL